MISEKTRLGLMLVETLTMAELFSKSDKELIKEAKEISEKTVDEPIHLTNPKLCHRFYCLAKELNRRGYSIPAFNFIDDVEQHLKMEAQN